MEQNLTLMPRTTGGTRPARRLRREGVIPAVVYGLKSDTTSVSVQLSDLRAALSTAAGRNAVLTLDIEGNKEMGIVKDIQWHPYRDEVLHVDFLRINPDQDVTVEVPIQATGDPHTLNLAGGILDQLLFTLTVVTKPNLIPDLIEVDVTEIEIGDTITVGDISMPRGSTTPVDPETSVLVGAAPRIAEVEVEVEEEEELEGEAAPDDEAAPAEETGDEEASEEG